ncbi:hypothetical protein PTKIN_Ptkin03bG0004000 [Pterospermum kingtungense]
MQNKLEIAKKDWRKLFDVEQLLNYISPTILDGEAVAAPPKNTFEQGEQKWQNVIVTQVIGNFLILVLFRRWSMGTNRKAASSSEKHWKMMVKSELNKGRKGNDKSVRSMLVSEDVTSTTKAVSRYPKSAATSAKEVDGMDTTALNDSSKKHAKPKAKAKANLDQSSNASPLTSAKKKVRDKNCLNNNDSEVLDDKPKKKKRLGHRHLIEIQRAGYNIELSAPLDNIPFFTGSERQHIEENIFRNKLKFFAAAKVSSSFPAPDIPEIAFAGRSNVGKSSLLNALTRQWGVVWASDKPGHTQTINFFNLGSKLCLVDLPMQRKKLRRRGRSLFQTKYQIVLIKTDTVFPIDVARCAMLIEENLKVNKSVVQPVLWRIKLVDLFDVLRRKRVDSDQLMSYKNNNLEGTDRKAASSSEKHRKMMVKCESIVSLKRESCALETMAYNDLSISSQIPWKKL